MKSPYYIGLEQAREVLAEMGIELNARQMKCAADKDASGRRKLPFFVDPIEGKLKIEKGTLVRIYSRDSLCDAFHPVPVTLFTAIAALPAYSSPQNRQSGPGGRGPQGAGNRL